MDLNEINIFAQVVKAGSFTAAAHKLAMPKSTVSRKVSELETRLGAQLLQRTTRKLHLTDAGRAYAQYAERIVAEVEAADLAVVRMQETPRGLLRISGPLGTAFLGTPICSFLERYPETQIELVGTDRLVDLVNEGFDLAIRAGKLADSSLIARSLGALQNIVVASPRFVKKHGAPRTPKDLTKLPCLVFGAGSQRNEWVLVNKDKEARVRVPSRLVANDFEMLVDAAIAGAGVALVPTHLVKAGLKDKQLVRLLTSWITPPVPLHAVYPGTRLVSPKVRAFIDHITEQLLPAPWTLTKEESRASQ